MKTIYYLYHIPGKKIGVTRDLNKRVTVTQGYKPDEYEVLDSSEDINYISDLEIELQKSYGYKVDRQKYNNLTNHKSNKMKLNVTEQTTTFPVSKIHLFKELLDNRDLEWETSLGAFKLSLEAIHWITANSHKSMYNDKRSYIYNKAFYEAFNDIEHTPKDIKISSKFVPSDSNIHLLYGVISLSISLSIFSSLIIILVIFLTPLIIVLSNKSCSISLNILIISV